MSATYVPCTLLTRALLLNSNISIAMLAGMRLTVLAGVGGMAAPWTLSYRSVHLICMSKCMTNGQCEQGVTVTFPPKVTVKRCVS